MEAKEHIMDISLFNFLIAIQERFPHSWPVLAAYQYGSEKARTNRWILSLTTYGAFSVDELDAIQRLASKNDIKLDRYFKHKDNQLELWISLG